MPETPTLAEVIRGAIATHALDLHTAMPGRVVSYDGASQTADVQPVLRQSLRDADGARVLEELPVIPHVPVVWPRAGGYCLTMPLAAGDHVLLVFCEGSIDAWRGTGDVSDPGDDRRHNLSHAVAIPGMFPSGDELAAASADHLVLGRDSDAAAVHVRAAEVRLGTDAAVSYVALATLVNAELTKLATTLASVTGGSGSPVTFGVPYVRVDVDATKVKAI